MLRTAVTWVTLEEGALHHYCFTRAGLWALELQRIGGGSPLLDLTRPAGALAARHAGGGDVAALSRAMGVGDRQVMSRFALGKRCYVAEVAGQIVSYGWVSLGQEEIPELERALHPAAGECYIWDCFTLPAYRGRRLVHAILRRMAIDLRRLGLRRAWAVILADNHSSQRAFQRAGFVPVADLSYLRLLVLRQLWLRAQPEAPAHLVSAARRLLAKS